MTTLVLLPGMDGTGLLLSEFVAALGTEIDTRVIRYPSQKVLSYAELEALVRASLPTDRPFVLLGESFSGPIAISIAAAPPPNLCGLVLNCTFPCLPVWRGLSVLVRLMPAFQFPFVGAVGRILLGRFSSEKLMQTLSESIAQVSPKVRKDRMCSLIEIDVTEKLSQISVPTLILCGSEDRLLPRKIADAMANKIPRATVEEFEAPHGLLQTVSVPAAATIRKFMAQCAMHRPAHDS